MEAKQDIAIDFQKIAALIEDGYVNVNKHPNAELYIYNYTAKTQYDWLWNDETRACRGLITDENQRIISRPFPKFFNLAEEEVELPNEPFEVFEKMDGSLGVLYTVDGQNYIASRGSFASEQAQVATSILQGKYADVTFDADLTYLFEIIYPANRIVVDYGSTEDLVLIGMIETSTGKELPLQDIGLPVVKRYDGFAALDQLKGSEEDNREGYVVKFAGGYRVKVKFEEYCRLHRIVTQVSSRHIWELLKDEAPLDPILDTVPDEFYDWVRSIEKALKDGFASMEEACIADFEEYPTRKEAAEQFLKHEHSSILFAMLDERDYRPMIWRKLRPEHERPFENEKN
jgi:T4 RnlA family RNA ligase